MILPQMVARRRGLIINMSSMSSFLPLPLMTAYSATKAFVNWFSQALEYEYRSRGIVVQCLMPSYLSTGLTSFSAKLQRVSLMVPDADRFARSALATVGYSRRTTGYWSHGLQWWLYSQIPESWWFFFSWYLQKWLHDSSDASHRN